MTELLIRSPKFKMFLLWLSGFYEFLNSILCFSTATHSHIHSKAYINITHDNLTMTWIKILAVPLASLWRWTNQITLSWHHFPFIKKMCWTKFIQNSKHKPSWFAYGSVGIITCMVRCTVLYSSSEYTDVKTDNQ